ncbi:LysM peptidoglycan-binding domain-containing protein [Albimonas pacifica]|uniref:LysM domain-containing protein n=1 Tax=Albimonas pacifica TaxID=1114924 RepID=A0A1I3K8E4_9RHOB|nr:LysM peptidoglycan-binding domain-containing protein [Albimonas pacifica]SFI68568.1 LysM domain-containing protein [Albimonas pacifica]
MADSKATMRIAAVAIAAAAAGAAVLAMTGWLGPSGPGAPSGAPDAPPAAQPAGQGGAPAAAVLPAARSPEPDPRSAPAPDLARGAPEPPAAEIPAEGAPPAEAPRFDVVRVEPDGAALVAGRAAPGATVEARIDGETVGEATADATGQFVLFAQADPGPAAREMTLAARLPGRPETVSADSVLILPGGLAPTSAPDAAAPLQPAPAAGEPLALAAAPPAAGDRDPAPAPAAAAGETPQAAAPGAAAEATVADAPDAPPVLLRTSSTGGVSVLDPAALGPASGVTLDALTYTARGEVHLAGRGTAGRTARIYADDRAQADAPIDGQGTWTATLASLTEPGRYTLRVDEIDDAGRVASRIESPFLREPPEALAALPDQVVVQPGHSLWAIAHARYGSGTRYALIYGANRERIRDPDLIYPGQVFDLPSGEAPPPR